MAEKNLKDLAARIEGAVVKGRNVKIRDIADDSREVTKGALFIAMRGLHVDGLSFLPKAVELGAVAVLADRDVEVPHGIAVLRVPDLAAALAEMVPYFHDYPAKKLTMIGITGTNGKTTTSYMLRHILRSAGRKVGLIGTIKILIEEEELPIHNTTPNVVVLQRLLARMAERGIDTVVMEVSSHALALNRIAGCFFDRAVFTNLTQDHLDFHKTMEVYALAKAKLFESLAAGGKEKPCAIVNIDDAAGALMIEHTSVQKYTYGVRSADAAVRAGDLHIEATGARCVLSDGQCEMSLNMQVTGLFNVYNMLAAAATAISLGVSRDHIKAALESFAAVDGRFEQVRAGQDYAVIVDYAHTPDGLENILKTAREIAKARIITVFGCGGDRDNTKRPIMGRIAARLSDVVLATSDNPRSEDPAAILREVETGVLEAIGTKWHELHIDRRKAIQRAVEIAEKDDIVIIAGKGHEDYQILKDRTIHFDDREEARFAVEARRKADELTLTTAEVMEATSAADALGEADDRVFTSVTTDTRKIKEGALFVALKGEKYDGADFALDAVRAGAAGVVVAENAPQLAAMRKAKEAKGALLLTVGDTLLAYQQIAAAWRRRFSIPVVAVTGSSGKTTTKELTAAVLGARNPVLKTEANYNNEIGLPLTLLGLRLRHKAAVVEIGMSGLGQIAALAPVAAPDIAIVTNVGEVHIEHLGSIENIAKAKLELVESLEAGGTAILNADDPRVAAMAEQVKPGVKVVTYGLSKGATVRGEAIAAAADGMHFMVTFGRERHSAFVPIPGRHNIYNGLAAIAAGLAAGCPIASILAGLSQAKSGKMRMDRTEVRGITLIDDTYNANPTSTRAALAAVAGVSGGRRVAVLGDMLELGEWAEARHREIGEAVAKLGYDALFHYGELSRHMGKGAADAGVKKVVACDSHEAAAKALADYLRPGDTVLFKGSRGMHMEHVLTKVKEFIA
ncbi:hypothetical protein TAMA11512_04720 [Selenomonas sp. TAMA-11512]|uniref:UDP-N-acetylmuramoyl-L-alanyl-D-glutamate--2, 6-diaminopimelate ligase n=1 Tax=Selenomonas sp. TAMA-11512 TaxID=3095337 RepID=UPI0030855371|nr:hypothetical protein TAMA11512_04720 [Selenomonas sp. TAMA-11512]